MASNGVHKSSFAHEKLVFDVVNNVFQQLTPWLCSQPKLLCIVATGWVAGEVSTPVCACSIKITALAEAVIYSLTDRHVWNLVWFQERKPAHWIETLSGLVEVGE